MKSLMTLAVVALLSLPGAAQTTQIYVPDNMPAVGTCNVFPLGTPAHTYIARIPASYMDPALRQVEEILFTPCSSNTWSAPDVQIGLGHLTPGAVPIPFTFPTISGGVATGLGNFLDMTVIWDSTLQGGFSFPYTMDQWSPMGFAGMGGTPFVWDGVNDVGFFITCQGATGTSAFHRTNTEPFRAYTSNVYQSPASVGSGANGLKMSFVLRPASGLYANFVAAPASGPAPLTVAFTDTSVTSDPNGIQTWAWDFGDGNNSTMQNPTHTYACPGSYAVSLMVMDTINAPATTTLAALQVETPAFTIASSGGGVGDLTVLPIDTNCYPTAAQGYTLITFAGPGPFLGIMPDAFSFQFILSPAAPGNIPHFITTPTTYPNGGPVVFPAGAFAGLAGLSMTAVEILQDASGNLILVSNASTTAF